MLGDYYRWLMLIKCDLLKNDWYKTLIIMADIHDPYWMNAHVWLMLIYWMDGWYLWLICMVIIEWLLFLFDIELLKQLLICVVNLHNDSWVVLDGYWFVCLMFDVELLVGWLAIIHAEYQRLTKYWVDGEQLQQLILDWVDSSLDLLLNTFIELHRAPLSRYIINKRREQLPTIDYFMELRPLMMSWWLTSYDQ